MCRCLSILQDNPDNPLRSEDIENYYQINSKGVLFHTSSSCHSNIDFSGIMTTFLSHLHHVLIHLVDMTSVFSIQQCCRLTSTQEGKEESIGLTTLREGEIGLKTHKSYKDFTGTAVAESVWFLAK